MTREYGILFRAPLVRALLDGRKIQMRRIVSRSNSTVDGYGASPEFWGDLDFEDAWVDPGLGAGAYLKVAHLSGETRRRVRCRWSIGDRLYAKETHVIETSVWSDDKPPHEDGRPIRRVEHEGELQFWQQPHYRATDPLPEIDCEHEEHEGGPCPHWRPSIFMPRWASRIVREVVSVRPERLHEITAEDARAEGIEVAGCDCEVCSRTSIMCPATATDYLTAFRDLWCEINGRESWERNPYVWRVEFREVQP